MKDPMKAMNSSQKQVMSEFQSKSKDEQMQMIADKCNQAGISKEQLSQLLSVFN